MRIPTIIKKNNHKYMFIKRINKDLFLYRNIEYGYKECFTRFDLGIIKEIMPITCKYINPENVKI